MSKEASETLIEKKSELIDDPKSIKHQQARTTIDDLIQLIGPMGKWQLWSYFWISVVFASGYAACMSVVFFQITPQHTCKLPVENNWTFEDVQSFNHLLLSKKSSCEQPVFDPELLRNPSFSEAFHHVLLQNSSEKIQCKSWLYKSDSMNFTIVNQWDLVCDRKWLVEHSTLSHMLGIMFGSLINGFISDRFGRKPTLVGATIVMSAVGIMQGFLTNFWVFLVSRFFFAGSLYSYMLTLNCLAIEITSARHRPWVGTLAFLPGSIGYASLSFIAYWAKDWRKMQVAAALPSCLWIVLWWVIPESPRWLLVNRRVKEAELVVRNAASKNGSQLPENIDLQQISDDLIRSNLEASSSDENFFQIFKYPVLVFRAVILFIVWFTVCLVYFGVSLNTPHFAGNIYLNNFLCAFVEIPGYIFAFLLSLYGRRLSMASTLFTAGFTLFAVPWIDIIWLQTAMTMVGKMAIAGSFGLAYTMSAELYPTAIRNSGVSCSSAVGRFGAACAPYVAGLAKLGESSKWIPLIILGSASTITAVSVLFLPETKGKRLPETISDALNLGKSKMAKYEEKDNNCAEI